MSKQQLPKKIINFNSADKDFHQKPDEDIANFPSPVIAILFGNVNCGKSRLMKNILVHKSPVYERIVIYTPLEDDDEEEEEEEEEKRNMARLNPNMYTKYLIYHFLTKK